MMKDEHGDRSWKRKHIIVCTKRKHKLLQVRFELTNPASLCITQSVTYKYC
jgi:hypothetical protein